MERLTYLTDKHACDRTHASSNHHEKGATIMSERHRITDAANAKAFVLAGNAHFTIVSPKTGTRYTYRVKVLKEGDAAPTGPWFASLLTGPDNESCYEYFGTIFANGAYRTSRKSRITDDAPSVRAFAWVWHELTTGSLRVEFWHEGRCGRCGRTLTVPESIASGFGPICIAA